MYYLRLRGTIKDYSGPAGVVFGPPIVVAVFVIIYGIPWSIVEGFLAHKWGEVGSLWGFLVGVYVLIVAKGAKRAAEEARARERERSLVEELEDANNKIQQVGLFARDGKWDVVQLRAEEVLTSCRSTIARWGEHHLPKDSRNKLLTTSTIIRSIADVAAVSSLRDLTERQHRGVLRAQLDASELLSAVLGECRKVHERVGE